MVSCQSIGEHVQLWKLDSFYLSHGDTALVSYSCNIARGTRRIVGFDVILQDAEYPDQDQLVFRDTWPCVEHHRQHTLLSISKRKYVETYRNVMVKFPNALRFRPDYINFDYYPHNFVKIRVWLLDEIELKRFDYLGADVFNLATIRSETKFRIRPPYSRACITTIVCLSFAASVLHRRELKTIYQCPYEKGTDFFFRSDLNSFK